MKPEYEPKTLEQVCGKLVEECAEVQHAIGKILRFGLDSYNPEIPPEERETNHDYLNRELEDLETAIRYMQYYLYRYNENQL